MDRLSGIVVKAPRLRRLADTLMGLVKHSDVAMDNFVPEKLAEFGLDTE